MRFPLLLVAGLIPFFVEGQTAKPTSKQGPTVQELQQQIQKNQQQIIDLQGQLLACQGVVKANAANPMKEAIEAFQTFE